jgi:6-pyruvoyltetrahydropterin/6-carboxytetrahydropterin synthase
MHFSVRASFPAAHRIRVDRRGTREPSHVHNWRVEACLEAGDDDAPTAARAFLDAWVARHEGRSFNDVPPFDQVNPTAEEVARVFATEIAKAVPAARLLRVEIGEAAGFSATYWPGR